MRLLARSLLGLLVIAAGCAAALVWYVQGTLPETAGERAVPGLLATVTVARDTYGIPTIKAQSEADAFFALGVVHAQDRLWQMDMMRRLATGRLSEILGEVTLETDKRFRLFGFERLARRQLTHLAPTTRRRLDRYAAGVNAAVDSGAAGLPPEFALLGYGPEPWQPWHSLLWQRLMSARLASNWQGEVQRQRLAKRLNRERLDDLWAAIAGTAAASNAWAVSGARTASGKPLLAGDPHLGLQLPTPFYLARIEIPGATLTGATAPGVPALILGHNGHLAWSFTTTHADTADLFIETLVPDDPQSYLAPDGPRRLESRIETIRVKDSEDLSFTVRTSRHGPIVSDLLTDAERERDLGPEQVVALAAPFLRADDTTPDALFALDRARTVIEARAGLEDFHAPVQNVTLADRDGRIALGVAGLIPVRKAGDGWLPVHGAPGAHDWTGFIPFPELPWTVDPPGGQVINANNRIGPEDYPYLISRNFVPAYRADRIRGLLGSRSGLTAEDFRVMQLDHISLMVAELSPLLLRHLQTDSEDLRPAMDLLRAWDGAMDRRRPEPALFYAWLLHLERRLWEDDLDGTDVSLRGVRPLAVKRILEDRPDWCDDRRTSATQESCGDQVAAALASALDDLRGRFSGTMDTWTWGELHRARFGHPILRRIPVLRSLFEDSRPTDGGETTVSRGTMLGTPGESAFNHVHGSVYRAVYDLADLDASLFVMPGGQSANPASPHFGDLTELWATGEMVKLTGAGSEAVLTLVP